MAIEKSLANRQWDPFLAMDRLDDQAIIAELQGQTVKALVYEFKQNGQLVTGLSKAGVDAVVREMAKQGEVLREMELNVLETPDEFVAQVKAGRFIIQSNQQTGEVKETLLDVVFGVKRQPKKHPTGTSNPFAYEQAVSKAARNAKMRLLREDLKQTIIALARKEGRVKEVKPEVIETEKAAPARNEAVTDAKTIQDAVLLYVHCWAEAAKVDPAEAEKAAVDFLKSRYKERYEKLTVGDWQAIYKAREKLVEQIAPALIAPHGDGEAQDAAAGDDAQPQAQPAMM